MQNSTTTPDQPKSRTRSRVVTAALGLGVLGASIFGWATFTTNSEPWAKAEVAQMQHVNATGQVVGKLMPGYANDTTFQLTNPNSVRVKVSGVSQTGYRNCDDPAPSENGGLCRLTDFMVDMVDQSDIVGIELAPGQTKTVTLHDAVGLKSGTDDARQGKSTEVGYFIAFDQVAGNEVP